MPLRPGARLGPYEVTGAIGAGGMGAVYRARDTRLNRDVALKVLPDLFASDPERLARFAREAQVLAALNHPNIAHIHGLEELPPSAPGQSGGHALVMEFVDGEELTAHIGRGPTPVADAVAIVAQIAAALETAHEQGIVHRDLKPANVKVRMDGTVKVLDFGLAKALAPEGASATADAMNSPTLTARATAMGMIIGTAAYMAPEQAKGKAVDRRADIWAFGVVLYELLAGRRAFDGEDVSTTLAAVLMKDPDWSALPADTPDAIRTLLRRCLERDPKQRLRDIGEARILLNSADALRRHALDVAPPAAPSSRLPWFIAAAAVIAAAIFGVNLAMSSGAPVSADRLEASLAPLKAHAFAGPFALSPDGRRLVAPLEDDDTGATSLYVRDLSGGQPVEIPHTEGGFQPFWSPDSREVAFFAEGKLKRVDLLGGSPQVLCDAPSPRGGTWGPDNLIIFAGAFRNGLEKIDARGGKPVDLTKVDATKKEKSHRWPVFLPGATDILFLAQTGEAGAKDDASAIEVLTLATGARTRLVDANSAPLYSTAGFLLFWREGALRAQAFNAGARTMSGDVFVVANDVFFDTNEKPMASIAGSGTFVYASGSPETFSSLLVVDRSGKPAKTIAESAAIRGDIALSHDGTRVAASVYVKGAKEGKVWLYDLTKDTARPFTFGPGNDLSPIWLEDDSALAYTNDLKNDGTIFRRLADGRGESQEMASMPSGLWTWQWSKDGKWLVAGGMSGSTGVDIFRVDTAPAKVAPLVNSAFTDDMPSLSPDNRWLAYTSDETGRSEVYVRPLSGEGRWVVSGEGGGTPMWRRDGRELYFLTPQHRLMVVQVDPAGEVFHFGAPAPLFRADFPSWDFERVYAPFSDGKRFVIKVEPRTDRSLLTLVTNWKPASPR